MKKILRKISDALKSFFTKEFAFVKRNSKIAVDATQLLKGFVESPVATAIVNLIPGDLDNEILYKLRTIVPRITMEMALAHGIITQAESNHQVLDSIIKYLQKLVPEGRVGFWIELSGRINVALSDGKVTLAEGIALSQMVYAELKQK